MINGIVLHDLWHDCDLYDINTKQMMGGCMLWFFFYLYLSDEQVNKLKLITSYFMKIKGKIDTLLITTASRNCRNNIKFTLLSRIHTTAKTFLNAVFYLSCNSDSCTVLATSLFFSYCHQKICTWQCQCHQIKHQGHGCSSVTLRHYCD